MRRTILTLITGLLVGAVAATTLSAPTPADAANGDYAVMGAKNNSRNSTQFISRNSTQFRNTKAGRPAITLNVEFGAPPMAVNSDAMVDNLNADWLDNMSAEDLQPRADSCGIADAPDGVAYACEMSLNIPESGLLLMSGSIEMTNTSTTTIDTVLCRLYVDDIAIDLSRRWVDVDSDTGSDQVICATDAGMAVDAGTHTIKFALEGLESATHLHAAAAYAIYVPGS